MSDDKRIDSQQNASVQAMSRRDLDIVLKPLSRPELGDIRIDSEVFAVGRSEAPFASYGNDILEMLSRRHARIFCEGGVVYVADLDSRNGTTVNRAAIAQEPCAIRHGDQVCFGGVLSYRVEIGQRKRTIEPDAQAFSLTLTPASDSPDLQPIVIKRFPFLVSKSDDAFSRYRNDHGLQLSFLSRRHAHIFEKDGGACIEDLASSNGTFVDGLRLEEHAVPLEDGMLLAFGGKHFTYRVSIANGRAPSNAVAKRAPDEDITAHNPVGAESDERKNTEARPVEPRPIAASDKTTFVVAPTSFLDIFCVDEKRNDDVVPAEGSTLPNIALKEPAKRRSRGRSAVLLSELVALFAGAEQDRSLRSWWKVATALAVLAAVALGFYFYGASERELKGVVARGEYVRAFELASAQLEQHPDDAALKAIATEAALKSNVPLWLAKLQARDFDGAKAVLANMSGFSARNPDLRALVGELEWLGNLERFVSVRGGPDAPIRIYNDEDNISALIARWNDNTGEHQRALSRIAAYVPTFSDPYAEALTHLRKLQSDATVYLAAIDRLKTSIATELNRDNPQALVPVLAEAIDKYRGIGGLENLRDDLARYIEIKTEVRARKSGRVFSLLSKARFTTPPFQEGFRALASSGQLPSQQIVHQYEAATKPWKQGDAAQSLAALQKMSAGGWAEAANNELARRQEVATQFASLQQSRSTSGYAEQLMAFRNLLDPDEDTFFAAATQADLELQKDKVLARAQDAMGKARAMWQEYRNNGAIEAGQRTETAISNTFKTRAHSLSEARHQSQLATQIYAQVSVAMPTQWSAIQDEIKIEADQQRNALLDLRNVLEPELLKSKLALLGEPGDGKR